jgi:hypothetical protein
MNKIYNKLFATKVENFLNEFFSSREVFEDISKRNKLLHPGEYGAYREKICDELIKFSIPSKFETATGFLINSFDEVSTQTDVVIYDLNNTPLIQNDSKTRFFPVESVVAIGEIKSKLKVQKLCEAAVKLAEIKKMKQIPPNYIFCINDQNKNNFNPLLDCHDTLFSFLICEEIENFERNKVFKKLNEAYNNAGIDYAYRHNIILSLRDGVLTYINQFTDLPGAISQSQRMYIPKFLTKEFENDIVIGNNYDKISFMLSSLSNFLMNVNIYYPEPNSYK